MKKECRLYPKNIHDITYQLNNYIYIYIERERERVSFYTKSYLWSSIYMQFSLFILNTQTNY